MKNMENLEKLCEIVERQLEKVVSYLDNRDSKLDTEEAKYIDTLTHTLKSIKTTMAMEGYGASERGRDSMGRFTRDGGSYRDGSYRESYGSYEGSMRGGDSYRSMHGDERQQLERMMQGTTDERVRRAIREAMEKI